MFCGFTNMVFPPKLMPTTSLVTTSWRIPIMRSATSLRWTLMNVWSLSGTTTRALLPSKRRSTKWTSQRSMKTALSQKRKLLLGASVGHSSQYGRSNWFIKIQRWIDADQSSIDFECWCSNQLAQWAECKRAMGNLRCHRSPGRRCLAFLWVQCAVPEHSQSRLPRMQRCGGKSVVFGKANRFSVSLISNGNSADCNSYHCLINSFTWAVKRLSRVGSVHPT